MITLQGKGVSDGIALGRLVFFERSSVVVERKPITDLTAELERFYGAKRTTSDQLDELANSMAEKIGKENALLFEIHRMMLDDSDYIDPIIKMIETQMVCAEYAVEVCGKRLAQDFAEMDDTYMKERAADVDDVSRRLIGVLYGTQKAVGVGDGPVIFASDDFSPSETAQFDRRNVLALVSQQGAANSHTAIFARTMGIPAIIGLGATLAPGFGGKDAALDGETGVLYIEPDAATITAIEEKRQRLEHKKNILEKFRGLPTLTKGGQKVKLYANIGSVADVEAVIAGDAEGIGLFRSEFLYLGRSDYPSEDIQYESYRKVVEDMQGKQVIIRTLDIGADKQVEYFALPHEENPALGMRAIRICLTRPELFETQLRAIYRASAYGNTAIMFPMISDVSELRRAKKIAAGVREKLKADNIPFNPETPVGIMIETPAAAMISDLLAVEADFFSIGTNDLTQYTLAVDRQNNALSEFCNTHHEAILRFIRLTAENAHRAGIWCGICGMLGADSELTESFVNMGIDELSVEPSCILDLRSRIAGYE
ncbi:phosphoenolpyruvate-protein phosphotransferase [Treponema primitia ZAS-2]|uniref:Phosphoenolpyruvate-protein phosphotransferase n=1 Tax=Treponema primitia (strain ATCC BAA-887 / DSM 12427 / ZAS-2) TaxID=545694 RepID=F5YP53_TREPZ|nr:phosphoenolpyruvate--protein phosphotransferase [Treponema primitia]AEF86689.1 phosphoenolpyruvate-protein phosphotransferase [Treponema primitia ZAS-2]